MKFHFKLKKLLEALRYFDPEQKKLMIPLLEYCEKLHEKNKELENELNKFKQPKLFTNPYPEGSHISKSFVDPPEQKSIELKDWLKKQFETGQIHSEKLQIFLKRKNWTIEDAKKMAELE